MRKMLHTVILALLGVILLTAPGGGGDSAVEETGQRESEAIPAMKQLSLVEYRVRKSMLTQKVPLI